MNYERILLSLLDDVAALKEKVAALEASAGSNVQTVSYIQKGIINDISFLDYLISVRGMKANTAQSRNSNCNRVERFEGSIKDHFEKDKCNSLLMRLEYSMDDQVHNIAPKHSIPIDGNIFNGTATLRQAVNLYIDYLKAFS